MWRIVPFLLAPVAMLAQPVPKSMLAIELDPARRVLQVRNHYQSDAISIVVAHSNGNRYDSWKTWDAANCLEVAPLQHGDARDITLGPPDWESWDILAVVYADGNVAGSREVIQAVMQGHAMIASELEVAIHILNSDPDPATAIDTWFDQLRKPSASSETVRRRAPGSLGIHPEPPLMTRLRVPRYVRTQLQNGVSRPEIVAALTAWRERLKTYQAGVVYL
ncbi:MAG TPA: hypothetical protein VGL72_03440 [Bryobacteraceae bacterium]|jgi:hypothetical protein